MPVNTTMPPQTKKPGITKIIIAFVILVILGGYMLWMRMKKPVEPVQNTTDVHISRQIESEFPTGITKDLILEKDVIIIDKYTATNPNGDTQSTVIYPSKKSPTEILTLYREYIKNSGWGLNNFFDQGGMTGITAWKDGKKLMVSSAADRVSGNNIVDITIVIPSFINKTQ